ncbi:MAG: aspartate aminotransferase family protein [Gammaproteobacteria bacterium]|nr:aspartate aminotransferase family protein [Gammaproteobacteria bacterium]
MPTYGRLPVTFERGEGSWLWDTDGQKYLDAFSGVAVCNLGHSHPNVSNALCEQAKKLVHTSNWYGIAHQKQLAEELTRLSGMDNVFFCNSGAEANETAIKIARLYGHKKKISNPVIVVTERSFHGRTLATLSATGSRKVQAGFEPLVTGFIRVPFNDLDALNKLAENSPDIVAILVEPVQGEGGVNIPDEDYLPGIRKLCDEHQWLMMLDEVQTGMCRTGKWFAFQHSNSKPDVMPLAKALANGVPIGACLAHGAAADVLQQGNHGSTFGGNPLATSAAIATIKTMEENDLANQALKLGRSMLSTLQNALAKEPHVKDIRGLGLMIGIELDCPCFELVTKALEQKLLINVTAERVIRLLPPLTMSESESRLITDQVISLVRHFVSRI